MHRRGAWYRVPHLFMKTQGQGNFILCQKVPIHGIPCFAMTAAELGIISVEFWLTLRSIWQTYSFRFLKSTPAETSFEMHGYIVSMLQSMIIDIAYVQSYLKYIWGKWVPKCSVLYIGSIGLRQGGMPK